MNITIVNPSKIPALLYGGTERVIWYLGKELAKLGHDITYLVAEGSYCDFAKVLILDQNRNLNSQIPKDTDIAHFNFPVNEQIDKPFVTTIHGNSSKGQEFHENTIFVSSNHAERHNSDSFVYNGLDWADYGKPDFNSDRKYFHFLGNAAWKVKNLKAAINTAKIAGEELCVMGGKRLNFKMGFRFTTSTKVKFLGMVGGDVKNETLARSKGLIFPVLWHEPFGLAITESMYFGCPVFGTPYGSLPELVKEGTGVLSENSKNLVDAVKSADSFNRKMISEYAIENFNSKVMALNYLKKYEKVISGEKLNREKPKYSEHKNNTNFIFE